VAPGSVLARTGDRSTVLPEIRGGVPADADACVAIVASTPDYFTPDTHEKVRLVSWLTAVG
jgi:hypothetical protein